MSAVAAISRAVPPSAAPVGPARIMQIGWGMAGTAALVAGIELGVFTRLDDGAAEPAALAADLKVSVRGLEGLLLGLAALGLLRRDESGRYALSEEASWFLVEGKPTYLGGLRHVYRSLNSRIWPRLTEAVEDGHAFKDLFAVEDEGNWDAVVPYLNVLGRPAAEVLAAELGRRLQGPFRVLDAGCGSGLYGQTVALRNPEATVVAIDREDVLHGARAQAEALGVADRVTDRVGDLRAIDFGSGFDVVILSHVLHGYGSEEARELVGKCAQALGPGGLLVINEFLPDREDPTRTPMQALFGLQMLMTSEGAAYDRECYQRWSSAAGLSRLQAVATPGPMTLLFGARPA